jgi:hypothetical protein
MTDTSVPRREFIKVTAAATAATALSYSRIIGAADRVRLGVIGCGGRGTGDMNNFLALGPPRRARKRSGTTDRSST